MIVDKLSNSKVGKVMSKLYIQDQTIGIVGGGHLARMLTLTAHKLGLKVAILDPHEHCQASAVADWHIQGEYHNEVYLMQLNQMSDFIIFEYTSYVESQTLPLLKSLPQGLAVLELAHHRLDERRFLNESAVNIPPFEIVHNLVEVYEALESIGFPCVLKTVRRTHTQDDYFEIKELSDVKNAQHLFKEGPCLLESEIPYSKEIRVSVVSNGEEAPVFFPIVEKKLLTGRLEGHYSNANLLPEEQDEVYRIAEILSDSLAVQGILTIKMKINEFGIIYVTGFEPTTLDDGIYSEVACSMSQFEAHIRGLCGWPLPLVTVLGEWLTVPIRQAQYSLAVTQLPFQADWRFLFYGQKRAEFDENSLLGHVLIPAEDRNEAIAKMISSHIWND